LIRVVGEAGFREATLETRLDEQDMESVKQMVISGRREEAIRRYQELSGVDAEQARRTIDRMRADFSAQTIFHQQLTPGGIAVVLVSLTVLPASLLAWWLGQLNPWLALVLAVLSGIQLFVYGRGALVSLRYWNAPVAPATTLYYTHIGALKRGRMQVDTFRCVLEVQPMKAPSFQAEAFIPVRAENVSRLRQGAVIQVKYLPGEPGSVIFHQR
jgi:hypothetical protein